VRLEDIQTANFAAETNRPLRGLNGRDMHQEIRVRGKLTQVIENMEIVLVEFVYSNSIGDEKISFVKGALVAVYAANDNSVWTENDDDILQQFAEVNGIYNTWSYIRELVASSLTRLGLPGVLLPVWRPPSQFPPEGEFEELSYDPEKETAEKS
jgi:hypothetical protein